ncbi:MAG: hypothetical protein ACTSRZ_01275 [Promethearchaeota archaeon]
MVYKFEQNQFKIKKHFFKLFSITLFILLTGLLFISYSNLTKDTNQYFSFNAMPDSSLIQDSQISYNAQVERVLGDLDVYVDLSSSSADPHTDATQVNLTISFSNGTVQNITQTSHSNYVWNIKYSPDANAPLGLHSFNITVFNGTNYYYSNNFNFTILDSYPKIAITLSNTTIYRNNTLYFNITPSDAEDSLEDLTWSSGIYKASNDQLLGGTLNSELERSYTFLDTFANSELGSYYIQATVTDKEGNSTTVREYFNVLNNIPQIEYVSLIFSDSEYTNPANNELLRGYGNINITVNATDVEKALSPSLKLNIKAINSYNVTLDFGSIDPINPNPTGNYQFNYLLNIPKYRESGQYQLFLTLYEENFGIEYNSTAIYYFTVINNPPNGSLIDFNINGKKSAEQPLTFKEFEDLEFSINVTDADLEGIELVKLCLIDEEGNWMNFSFKYRSNVFNFTLRARDLTIGQWNAYVYVIDSDGAEAVTQNVIAFDIQRDTFSSYLPYIMLGLGFVAGFIITFLAIGTKYLTIKRDIENGKLILAEDIEEKLETTSTKTKRRIKQRIESISSKEKPSKKKEKQKDSQKIAESKPKKKFIRKLD